MLVLVAMHLSDVEPDTRAHQRSSDNKLDCYRLA